MDNSLFMTLNGLFWPALGIFELVIAIIAQNKYKRTATGLMLAGSLIGLLTSLSYPLINLIGYYGENMSFIYASLNILGFFGNLLFLIGLFQLINYLASLKAGSQAVIDTF